MARWTTTYLDGSQSNSTRAAVQRGAGITPKHQLTFPWYRAAKPLASQPQPSLEGAASIPRPVRRRLKHLEFASPSSWIPAYNRGSSELGNYPKPTPPTRFLPMSPLFSDEENITRGLEIFRGKAQSSVERVEGMDFPVKPRRPGHIIPGLDLPQTAASAKRGPGGWVPFINQANPRGFGDWAKNRIKLDKDETNRLKRQITTPPYAPYLSNRNLEELGRTGLYGDPQEALRNRGRSWWREEEQLDRLGDYEREAAIREGSGAVKRIGQSEAQELDPKDLEKFHKHNAWEEQERIRLLQKGVKAKQLPPADVLTDIRTQDTLQKTLALQEARRRKLRLAAHSIGEEVPIHKLTPKTGIPTVARPSVEPIGNRQLSFDWLRSQHGPVDAGRPSTYLGPARNPLAGKLGKAIRKVPKGAAAPLLLLSLLPMLLAGDE